MDSTTLTAPQASQPSFADVRVGIMRTGIKDGRAVTQLALRSPRDQRIVILAVGDSVDLDGAGLLRIDEIGVPTASERGWVTFTFVPVVE